MTSRTASWSICFLFLIIAAGCKKDENPTNNNSTITVNGFVKDAAGEPINGVGVVIKGKSAVTSGADGSFSVAGVTTPYDVTIILSTQKAAIVYRGLTRTDPTLVYSNPLGTIKTATITGTVPAAATKTTLVVFVSGTTRGYTEANAATGAYTIGASWFTSSTSFSGKVYVLRWTPATSGFPTNYDAFGSKDLTISAGGSFTVNFSSGELTDPPEQTISGSVTRSVSTYSLSRRDLLINFGNSSILISGEAGTSPFADNFNIPVPSITGATYGIVAYATQTATPNNRSSYFFRAGIAPGATNVSLTLPAAPQLTSPVHNGTNVDTATSFLFSPGGASGVYQITISPAVPTNPSFIIYTSATSETIPNLTSLGLGLPAAANYTWGVAQYSPSSVNDAASGSGFRGENVGFGGSESFTFTTRP